MRFSKQNVGIRLSSDAASYCSTDSPRKFGGTSVSLSLDKDGWSLKQATYLSFIAVQRRTTPTFFVVGLLQSEGPASLKDNSAPCSGPVEFSFFSRVFWRPSVVPVIKHNV
jgi:hypothetical protein